MVVLSKLYKKGIILMGKKVFIYSVIACIMLMTCQITVAYSEDGGAFKIFKLCYLSPERIKEIITPYISDTGKFSVDESRTVFIKDNQQTLDNIEKIFNQLDKKGKQVFVKGRIIEITTSKGQNFGTRLKYNAAKNENEMKAGADNSSENTLNNTQGELDIDLGQSLTKGVNLSVSNLYSHLLKYISPVKDVSFLDNIDMVIEALISQQNAKVLARPSLLTDDGTSAVFMNGSLLPYTDSTKTAEGTLVSTKFLQTGIILHVEPVINQEDILNIKIMMEVSSITGPDYSGTPVVKKDYIASTVTAKSGEMIALGGILKDNTIKTIKKVPGLSAIPLFGRLFTSRSEATETKEIIIMLTPVIIDENDSVKEEDLSREN